MPEPDELRARATSIFERLKSSAAFGGDGTDDEPGEGAGEPLSDPASQSPDDEPGETPALHDEDRPADESNPPSRLVSPPPPPPLGSSAYAEATGAGVSPANDLDPTDETPSADEWISAAPTTISADEDLSAVSPPLDDSVDEGGPSANPEPTPLSSSYRHETSDAPGTQHDAPEADVFHVEQSPEPAVPEPAVPEPADPGPAPWLANRLPLPTPPLVPPTTSFRQTVPSFGSGISADQPPISRIVPNRPDPPETVPLPEAFGGPGTAQDDLGPHNGPSEAQSGPEGPLSDEPHGPRGDRISSVLAELATPEFDGIRSPGSATQSDEPPDEEPQLGTTNETTDDETAYDEPADDEPEDQQQNSTGADHLSSQADPDALESDRFAVHEIETEGETETDEAFSEDVVDLAEAGAPPAPEPLPIHPGPAHHDLPRSFAVANQKGGVGKTTTAVNLSAALAELGYRVLVVDLDPQGNATTGLGINSRNLDASIYDVILHDVPIEDVIEPTSLKNLFVVPATIDLAGAEIELVPAFSRELRLKRALEPIQADFDYVLIDCPPSLGLLTINGLAAVGEVIVPIQCEYYALEGLGQLLRNVNLVQGNLNSRLEVSTIILTMYDARTRLSEQVADEVREHFGDKVCRSVVPRTVRLSEAPSFGQPVITFDSSSRGATAYRDLAKEVSGGAPQRVR